MLFSLAGLCVKSVSQIKFAIKKKKKIKFAKLLFHLQKYSEEIKKKLPRALLDISFVSI